MSPQVIRKDENKTIYCANSQFINSSQEFNIVKNKNPPKNLNKKNRSKENLDQFVENIEPLKGELRDAIESRMSRGNKSELSFYRDRAKESPVMLSAYSTVSDVKKFLQSKGFSNK